MKLCLIKVGKLDACIRPLFANSVTNAFVAVLLNMVGEDIVGDVPADTDSYFNYVKVWTRTTDRGAYDMHQMIHIFFS